MRCLKRLSSFRLEPISAFRRAQKIRSAFIFALVSSPAMSDSASAAAAKRSGAESSETATASLDGKRSPRKIRKASTASPFASPKLQHAHSHERNQEGHDHGSAGKQWKLGAEMSLEHEFGSGEGSAPDPSVASAAPVAPAAAEPAIAPEFAASFAYTLGRFEAMAGAGYSIADGVADPTLGLSAELPSFAGLHLHAESELAFGLSEESSSAGTLAGLGLALHAKRPIRKLTLETEIEGSYNVNGNATLTDKQRKFGGRGTLEQLGGLPENKAVMERVLTAFALSAGCLYELSGGFEIGGGGELGLSLLEYGSPSFESALTIPKVSYSWRMLTATSAFKLVNEGESIGVPKTPTLAASVSVSI